MNLDELRSVQRAERQKDSLQHLRDEFYEDVAAYVAQLKDERERAVAAADDPFASEDVRQLTDKIESTTETANALYERRVGKVVKHASFAAAGMATDEDGMTTEERELFADLVARIRENRQAVLSTLDGDAGTDPSVADAAPTPADEEGQTDSVGATADAPIDASSGRSDDRAGEPSTPAPESESESTSEPTDDLLADALGDAERAPDGGAVETEASSGSPSTETQAPDADRVDGTAAASADTAAALDSDSPPDRDVGRPADEAGSVASEPRSDGAASSSSSASATAREESDTSETPDTDRTTLKITADVGTVYGVDEREYDLAREDVVTLPTTNAEPLLRKDAAERIDFD